MVGLGGDFIWTIFQIGDEEINLIRFIAKFQYLNISDTKYFFSSKKYYRNRVSNLVSKRFLKKVKSNLVLDELGIEYAKLFKFEYNKLNRNKKYSARLIYLSRLAAFYNNCDTVTFTPSFAIKDKDMFTITARRFIRNIRNKRIWLLNLLYLKRAW